MLNLPYEIQELILSFPNFDTALIHNNMRLAIKLCDSKIDIPKIIKKII